MKISIRTLVTGFLVMCISLGVDAQDTTQSSHNKKVKPEFHYPGKGFFFQGQFVGNFLEWGVRFAGGYRFGQFGILGLGVGVDESIGLSLSEALVIKALPAGFISQYMPTTQEIY